MKRKWGQVISGIQSWLTTLSGPHVLVSFFTYDSTAHNLIKYKTPEELGNLLNQGLEVSGGSYVSIPVAFKTTADIIGGKDVPAEVDSEWLHYQVLMTVNDFEYPNDALNEFTMLKKGKDLTYFINAITQLGRNDEITKVVTTLEGVHYSIKRGTNFTTAFIEALEKDPFKVY